MKTFTPNFLWGASSSAFQIEGGWNEDGKGMSVADYNSFQRSHKQADSKVASDFYHRYEEDIKLMHNLGLKTYRFSIAWSRIIPDGDGEINQAGIDFYNKVINCLLAHQIEPFITLYHFDLPFALVEKYNGWQNRDCAYAFQRFAQVCFNAFGDRVKNWQTHNEQNLMVRVNERINIYQTEGVNVEKVRAQMDYHMFISCALATNDCHKMVKNGKIGPAVSSTMTYPASNRPEDVWSARMNDNFKTNYALEMYCFGKYPAYYEKFLRQCDIYPQTEVGDEEILQSAKPDFLAINYYRTLVTRYLPIDEHHPFGTRERGMNEVDFNLYGYFTHEINPNLKASEYGAQIDPTGLRLVLNDYYQKYRLPMIITENGLGTPDILTEDGKVNDDYRIDYLRAHINACYQAIEDGVELVGYCPWSVIDLLSSHQGFKKRYGFVYVNRDDFDLKDLKRIPKASYYWYQNVIKQNGLD
ncbi:6-phospho-beta-glucosidase [Mannheimia varigena]|uniref:glycoside hydrolase family 1 protein n=1 Tax=Mannheimia varigena TaxID=85404 RepID=UPI001C4007F6|nr:glycoside hydrolase family 1 protein [Mannheimia varigena]QLB17411.1 6-phospho-beta-glucosidase [Mannheimia varigena]